MASDMEITEGFTTVGEAVKDIVRRYGGERRHLIRILHEVQKVFGQRSL